MLTGEHQSPLLRRFTVKQRGLGGVPQKRLLNPKGGVTVTERPTNRIR